jgi:hypothetical protein
MFLAPGPVVYVYGQGVTKTGYDLEGQNTQVHRLHRTGRY